MAPALGRDGGNALKGGQGLASHCLLSSGERPHLESSMRASLSAHQSNPGTPGPWCRGGVGLLGREEFPGAVVVFIVAVAHEPDKSSKACLAVLVSGALVCAVELR